MVVCPSITKVINILQKIAFPHLQYIKYYHNKCILNIGHLLSWSHTWWWILDCVKLTLFQIKTEDVEPGSKIRKIVPKDFWFLVILRWKSLFSCGMSAGNGSWPLEAAHRSLTKGPWISEAASLTL